MSQSPRRYETLCEILARELPPEAAERVLAALRAELGGLRITIPQPSSNKVTWRQIEEALAANGHNVKKAAKMLGVNPATVYRAMQAKRNEKPRRLFVQPRPTSRLVR